VDRPLAERIAITPTLSIDPAELDFSFIRSSGPGGQNVNKVSSAVQLRFDLKGSPSLPDPVKIRAAALAGSRFTNDGEIVMTGSTQRSQPQNREEVTARLIELLRAAAIPPKRRRATRPTLASKTRRLEGKAKRSGIKSLRTGKPSLD
jgi:ribosome-associated protein